MKKLILILSLFAAFAIKAQTLTQLNHTPSAWDRPYGMLQCDSLSVSAGSAGAAQTWSFTPISYPATLATFSCSYSNNVSFSPADAVVASGATNSSYYTTASANELAYYGGVIQAVGNNVTVKYAVPAIFAVYPMSLNTSTTSVTSGTINATIGVLPITAAFTGTCNVIADATGTLSLPGRDFTDIIRKTTNEVLTASGTATITIVKYEFFSPGSFTKAPILSIRSTTLTSGFGTDSQTFSYVLKDYDVVSVKENKTQKTALVTFPNPATHEINFKSTQLDVKKINVFDVTGKMIASEVIENGKLKLNVELFNAGLYFYSAIDFNNQVISSGKFTVSK